MRQTEAPYVYQEYPRHLHKPDGSVLVVNTDDEKAAALADGWFLTPGEQQPEPETTKKKTDKK